MARPLRIEFEGAYYHVTARGNERRKIFFTQRDFEKFKGYITTAQEKYGFFLHSYVLMSNHYHLIMETPAANLSRIMHHINSSYTTYVNIKRKRSGHLFQGRYKAIAVDKDSYLLELSRYLHLNPVRAKMVENPEDYPYSSYRSFISGEKDALVTEAAVLDLMATERQRAKACYRIFVEEALGKDLESPLQKVYAGAMLGNEEFIDAMLQRIEGSCLRRVEVACRQSLRITPSIEKIRNTVCEEFGVTFEEAAGNRRSVARKVLIYLMKKHTCATNREIGTMFGDRGDAAVIKTFQRVSKQIAEDEALCTAVKKLQRKLSIVSG